MPLDDTPWHIVHFIVANTLSSRRQLRSPSASRSCARASPPYGPEQHKLWPLPLLEDPELAPTTRGRSAVLAAISLVAATTLSATMQSAAAAAAPVPVPTKSNMAAGRYLVTLADQPIVAYQGGVDGIAATAPIKGAKVNVGGANARRYRDHLTRKQNGVAATVGAKVKDRYAVATNGFTATLSAAQAIELTREPGVVSVTPDTWNKTNNDTNSTDFLGLSGKHGLWASLGGTANAGKGVVIGDIDTGIWPESPSFAASPLSTTVPKTKDPYRPYLQGTTTVMHKADGSTFTGTCQTGEQFTANACNSKVISARYFGDGWTSIVPPERRADYISPRDGEGHGSHTASTAAGKAGVDVIVGNRDFGKISGVAPGAAIAVYKAFWTGKSANDSGALTSDIVAAVDQAVADGVDVLNYSAGSIFETGPDSPVQAAFRTAAAAGIFVSTAAGNSGPDPSSLDNVAPWTTTVAASTIQPYEATVQLGNGRSFVGSSTTVEATVGPKPLVLAENVRNANAAISDAQLCMDNSLDPAKVTGTIVVCDRGVNPRVAKSAEVARAGGVGMVLVNTSDLETDADLHTIPTVHLNVPDTAAIHSYAATQGATASLVPGGTTGQPYPQIAPFSSRGPSVTNKGDLLKPDIAAPGVGILAAVAPPSNSGHTFDFLSGTSMATPHISGLAALYLAQHPTWSPMAVKSAMMTTAVDTKTASGADNTDVYAQGAGEVSPSDMLNPGLVYDSSEQDWLAYLEGLGVDTKTGVKAVDPSDLNYPSISVGQLVGSQTITREVTATAPGTYRATVDVPGMKATVRPSTLTFNKAGKTAKFTVTFKQTTAPSGELTTGSLVWTHARTEVRSPIAITPWSVVAPNAVSGPAGSGSTTFSVTPGTADFAPQAIGPIVGPSAKGSVSFPDNSEQDFAFTVPEGTRAGQFFVTPDNPDAKLTLLIAYNPGDGQQLVLVGDIALDQKRPLVSLNTLKPGNYVAIVVTLGNAPGTTSTPFTFQPNLVTPGGPTAPGTFTVSPVHSATTPGVPVTLTASWTGVPGDKPATGYVAYPNGAGTLVTIG